MSKFFDYDIVTMLDGHNLDPECRRHHHFWHVRGLYLLKSKINEVVLEF